MTERTEWAQIPDESPLDLSHLKIRVQNRQQLNLVEAENIRKVTRKYLGTKPNNRLAPFTYDWVFALHEEMFCHVWEWAGQKRTRDGVNIGCPAHQITDKVGQLIGNLKSWGGYGNSLIEQAAMLHHQAVLIHPFPNGNGRWSRMLANIWLRRGGEPQVNWPDKLIGEVSPIRNEYIETLQEADRGDYAPLIALHKRFVESP